MEETSYDGFQADIFSLGVIIFITVIGNYPFNNGLKSDKYYSMATSKLSTNVLNFWKKTGSEKASEDFKDLFLNMIKYNPKKRFTLDQVMAHPWMQK